MSVVAPKDLEARRVSTGPMALSKYNIWQQKTNFCQRAISHIIIKYETDLPLAIDIDRQKKNPGVVAV